LRQLQQSLRQQISSLQPKLNSTLPAFIQRLLSVKKRGHAEDKDETQNVLLELQNFSLTYSGLNHAQDRELCERIAEEAPDFFHSVAMLARPMTYCSATAKLQAETFSLFEKVRKNGLSTLESLFYGYGPEGRLEVPWIDIASPTKSTFLPIHTFRECIENEVGEKLGN
jgi:hypothetical protein